MKKFTKVLSVFVVLFTLVFALTSCGEKQSDVTTVKISNEISGFDSTTNSVVLNQDVLAKINGENHKEDNIYLGLFDNVTGRLYLEGATVNKYVFKYDDDNKLVVDEQGTPQYYTDDNGNKIEAEYVVVVKGKGLPTLDKDGKSIFGPYFAGWYGEEGLRNDGARLATFTEFANDTDHVVYAYYIDFVQACLVAVVCVFIVFSMLLLLWGLVSLLRFVAPKQKEQPKPVAAPATPAAAPRQAISLADIKDEEMMAAALVATIDYHEETQEDVRVVSIKEIK